MVASGLYSYYVFTIKYFFSVHVSIKSFGQKMMTFGVLFPLFPLFLLFLLLGWSMLQQAAIRQTHCKYSTTRQQTPTTSPFWDFFFFCFYNK